MDFELSEEQQVFRKTLRDFVATGSRPWRGSGSSPAAIRPRSWTG